MCVTFISGSMFGRKSAVLIDAIEQVEELEENYIACKPIIDTRDGLFIRSRDYGRTVEALPWNHNSWLNRQYFYLNLINLKKVNNVFFDEAHFLSLEDMIYVVNTCKNRGINLFMSGLETDFRREYFPATKWLKDNSDVYMFFHGICNGCEKRNALYNVLYNSQGERVTTGDSIQVGSSEYKVLCEDCF